jgi:hypothetical protein
MFFIRLVAFTQWYIDWWIFLAQFPSILCPCDIDGNNDKCQVNQYFEFALLHFFNSHPSPAKAKNTDEYSLPHSLTHSLTHSSLTRASPQEHYHQHSTDTIVLFFPTELRWFVNQTRRRRRTRGTPATKGETQLQLLLLRRVNGRSRERGRDREWEWEREV